MPNTDDVAALLARYDRVRATAITKGGLAKLDHGQALLYVADALRDRLAQEAEMNRVPCLPSDDAIEAVYTELTAIDRPYRTWPVLRAAVIGTKTWAVARSILMAAYAIDGRAGPPTEAGT